MTSRKGSRHFCGSMNEMRLETNAMNTPTAHDRGMWHKHNTRTRQQEGRDQTTAGVHAVNGKHRCSKLTGDSNKTRMDSRKQKRALMGKSVSVSSARRRCSDHGCGERPMRP